MAWCKDYCLVCERETRIENGSAIPYCSQACRLADYDRHHDSTVCSLNTTVTSASYSSMHNSPAGIMPYTSSFTKELYLFPSPPPPAVGHGGRLPRRPSNTSSSRSGSLNSYFGPTSLLRNVEVQRSQGMTMQSLSGPSHLPADPQQTYLYNDPLGFLVAVPSISSSVTSTTSSGTVSSRGLGGLQNQSCHPLQQYASWLDQGRRLRTRP